MRNAIILTLSEWVHQQRISVQLQSIVNLLSFAAMYLCLQVFTIF